MAMSGHCPSCFWLVSESSWTVKYINQPSLNTNNETEFLMLFLNHDLLYISGTKKFFPEVHQRCQDPWWYLWRPSQDSQRHLRPFWRQESWCRYWHQSMTLVANKRLNKHIWRKLERGGGQGLFFKDCCFVGLYNSSWTKEHTGIGPL